MMIKRTGKEKNPYLLAFFQANEITVGKEYKTYEYMLWIHAKHAEFRKLYGLPENNTLNDEQVKVFIDYINK